MINQFLALSDRGKNGPLRWIGGTLTILFFWFIIGSFIAVPFLLLGGSYFQGVVPIEDPFWDVLASLQALVPFGGDPLWDYIGLNLSFLGIWLGLWLAVRFIHQRKFQTLVTPAPKLSWKRMAHGFLVWGGLVALFQVGEFLLYPQRATLTFDPARWFLFLPFVLILTPLQTTAEELLFRGYWLQGTGRLVKNVIVLSIINGLLFGLPHMLNPEPLANPDSTLILFLNYGLTGAALAFFTLVDQRLELAIGAHAANNLFGALLVNYTDSALKTPAIFTTSVLDANLGLVSLVIFCIAFYFIVFRLLGKEKMIGEASAPSEPELPQV